MKISIVDTNIITFIVSVLVPKTTGTICPRADTVQLSFKFVPACLILFKKKNFHEDGMISIEDVKYQNWS